MSPADPRKTRTIDVRPLLARGEEPFRKLMATVAALAPDETLVVIAPFLPSPLIERLQAAGFEARPERRTDGSWQTFFSR
jgi:hypothetical protein